MLNAEVCDCSMFVYRQKIVSDITILKQALMILIHKEKHPITKNISQPITPHIHQWILDNDNVGAQLSSK